jgi:hypothetical protein
VALIPWKTSPHSQPQINFCRGENPNPVLAGFHHLSHVHIPLPLFLENGCQAGKIRHVEAFGTQPGINPASFEDLFGLGR